MTLRRTSVKQHAAGGISVTGPLSISGAVDITSKIVVKAVQANSTYMGKTTVLSGTSSVVVSVSTVKSDSVIMLQPITANASALAINYGVNSMPVDGTSFTITAGKTTTVPVGINYMVVSTI